MAKFKINVGQYEEYIAEPSLETPDSKRRNIAWAKGSSPEGYNLDYTVANDTPLLPNNWYFDEYYCAGAGSYPQDVGVAGVSSGTWFNQNNAGGGWTTSLDADANCYNGYRVTINTTLAGTDYNRFVQNFAGSDWYNNIDNAIGYTILFRCKVITAGSSTGQMVQWVDKTKGGQVTLFTDRIEVPASEIAEPTTTYAMDTTDGYHTYKAVVVGTSLKIYVDDTTTPNIDVTLDRTSAANAIYWGDVSTQANQGGEVYWDFFTYYTGAEPALFGTDKAFELRMGGGGKFPVIVGTALWLDGTTDAADAVMMLQTDPNTLAQSLDNAEGYVVEASLKVVTSDSSWGQYIICIDGTYIWLVNFKINSIELVGDYIAGATQTYTMDTTDDYHDYKIVAKGTSVKVYADNVLVITGTMDTATTVHKIGFGNQVESSAYGGEVYWRYVKLKTFAESFAGVIACTSGSVPNEFCLDIATTAATAPEDYLYYAHSSGTAPFHLNANNVNGYTIEFQKKVIDAAAAGGQLVQFDDDVYSEYLKFYTSYVQLGNDGTTYPMTTTDDYHTYRITVKGTAVKVYENNALRITGVLATTSVAGSNKALYWGDYLTGLGGESRWGYVKYRTDGAFPPTETVDDGWAYSDFDIADKRTLRKSTIIRSDKSIIPDANYQPAKIKVKGTIVGSCWNSFKDTVRRLKRTLKAGTQKIYIDDEKYIQGINSNFTLKPDTPDFAKFDVNFDCRYPYWEQNWASYVSTSPVSGGTFYITNNGDIEVPCKVIVTGAASGTIDDDVQLQNVTKDQLGKLVAVLQQTSELVVDKGFDKYNDFKVEVGGAVSFGSYEGDLFTLAEGENAFVFTGGSVGTIEIYWREGFGL